MSRFRGQKIEEETYALFQRKALVNAVRNVDVACKIAFWPVADFVCKHNDARSEKCMLVAAALHKLLCSQLSHFPIKPTAAQVQSLTNEDPQTWSVARCWTAARLLHRILTKQFSLIAGPNSPLHADTFRLAADDWIVLRAVYEGLARVADNHDFTE